MEPLTLLRPAELTTLPLANASAASNPLNDAVARQQPVFSQAMQQALAVTPSTRNSPPSGSQLPYYATGSKDSATRSDGKPQCLQDSASDPTAPNPISMLLTNTLPQAQAPPLTLAPNLVPSVSPDPAPIGGPELAARFRLEAPSSFGSNLTADLYSNSSPNLAANPTPSVVLSPEPIQTKSAPASVAQDLVEPAGKPNLSPASNEIAAGVDSARIIVSSSPADQTTAVSSDGRGLLPTSATQPQSARRSSGPQTQQTPSTATVLPLAAGAPAVANRAATQPLNGAVIDKRVPDASAPACSPAATKTTSPRESRPVAQDSAPPSSSESDVAANVRSSPEQTAVWKEIAKAVIATPLLPSSGSALPSTSGNGTVEAGPVSQVSTSSQVQQSPATAHTSYQDSSANQGGARSGDPSGPSKGSASSTSGNTTPQFQPLSTPWQLNGNIAQPSASATATTVALTSDHFANAAASAPKPDAPSHVPLTSYQADSAPGKFINSAQLFSASGHSEMRVSLDSDKLGSVELRARLSGDQLGAAIMVEKREAHAALAVELPVLQQALSDRQLRVDQISLLHGSFSATAGDTGGSTQQEQRSVCNGTLASSLPEGGRPASLSAPSAQTGIFDSTGHLSVHA